MKADPPYLQHILHCIQRIREDSAAGKGSVFQSPTLQDAILRNLQLLCESAQRISRETKRRHPEIDWPAIGGLRNVLVHDYFNVDWEAIWAVIERDLPELERAVSRTLQEPGYKV